jgi:ABC-type nitrate/sulfonate/bicarbonate transport system substrate-binding protein
MTARLAAVSLVWLLLAACNSPAAPAAQATPAAAVVAPTQITACIPSRSDTILPMFAAQDAGLLAQEGLQAELPYFAGGQVDAALIAGQCDFVFGAGGVGPLLQGVDVVVIAPTTTTSPGEIWARPPLSSLADLKGHAIGTSGAGSLSWRVARYYLQANGLTPDQDVIVLGTGDSAATFGAVTSGRVDAALLFPPDVFLADQKGLTPIYRAPKSMQLMNTGLVTTRHYLAAHRDIARGMVRAVTEAMRRLSDNEDFYAAELAKFTQATVDPTLRTRYWRNAAELYTVPPRMGLEGAVTALTLYADQAGPQDLQALARAWLDASLVDELYPPGSS